MLDVMVPCLPTTFAKKRRVADDRYVARALVQLRSAGGQAIAVYYFGVGGVRGVDGPPPSLPFTTSGTASAVDTMSLSSSALMFTALSVGSMPSLGEIPGRQNKTRVGWKSSTTS